MKTPTCLPTAALLACVLVCSTTLGSPAPQQDQVTSVISRHLAPHPRLLLTEKELPAFQTKIDSALLNPVKTQILAEAERHLQTAPAERQLIGRRLLGTSRECLGRIINLSMAWRITKDPRFQQRATRELLAVAAFEDWNPKHYLDAAEMTAAVAIGYDWLYPELDETTRAILRKAIVEKGITPSLTGKHWWINGTNNWNQVCHGGLVLGALAVAEEEPALASSIITRAIEGLPYAMKAYEPDGAYPEGPGYWNYGTTYNVLLCAALETALGTDFELSKHPAFLASADYMVHVSGPTGLYHNYADCGSTGEFSINPTMFWFASKRNEPSLTWFEDPKFGKAKKEIKQTDRFFPLLLVWADPNLGTKEPSCLDWTTGGHSPVAFFRSGWDRQAVFVGIKGGSPTGSHAHMDGGSFVFDANGERWIHDLGMQNYESLEKLKIDLWNYKQDSQRWKVFRLSNLSHSTLNFNGQLQKVTGTATVSIHGLNQKTPTALVDCSSLYSDSAEKVVRSFSLQDRKALLIEDRVEKVTQPGTLRWQMVTKAKVTPNGKEAVLTQNGKTLRILSSSPANWQVLDISAPKESHDCPNPDAKLLVLDLPIQPGDSPTLSVRLTPGQ